MAEPTETPSLQPAPAAGEHELLSAYRSGDREAANQLVEQTYRAVYAALFRLTGGNRDLAADLTQETYRRAWQALPRFEGRSRLATWLYRIAYTTFLNHLRRPRPLDRPSADPAIEPIDPNPSPEQLAASAALDARLRTQVLNLPEHLRYPITAHFWGEQPVREIARAEGVTTVAIRKRLKRALGLLAAALEEGIR